MTVSTGLLAQAPAEPAAAWNNAGTVGSGLGTSSLSPGFAPLLPPLTGSPESVLGQWAHRLHLRLQYGFSHNSGGLVGPGEDEATYVQTLSPGIGLRLGDQWRLSYTPTLSFYSSDRYQDTTDHHVSLSGDFHWQEWYFTLRQDFAVTSEPLIETAQQTDQQGYTTTTRVTHALNSRLALDLGAEQQLREVSDAPDLWEWSTLDWLSYEVAPRLSVGPGAGFGYTMTDPGTDMTHEQLQVRGQWQASAKVTLAVNGGFEVRQMLGSGLADLLSPLFGATLRWQPTEVTALAFTADHAVSASYFEDQITESTTVGGSLYQRLLRRFYLSVGAGYRVGSYLPTAAGVSATRDDDTLYYNLRLSTRVLRRISVGAFYGRDENLSNADGYSFSNDRVGFDLGCEW